jgi:hypothetical protein
MENYHKDGIDFDEKKELYKRGKIPADGDEESQATD